MLKSQSQTQEDTRKVKAQTTAQTVEVRADGGGLVSRAGAYLLAELADRVGLTEALSVAMATTRERRSVHDPGVVLRDLAVSIADGGDCVSDLGVLAGQEALFGQMASQTTAHRVLKSIDEPLLDAIRVGRAKARERAWEAGARPREVVLDIDATLITAHSEKEEAKGNYKGGFGFHPLLCYLAETGEPLAGLLRPGNAGSNTAADHFCVLQLALEQLPEADLDREILVRTDVGGRTRAFASDCREAGIRFSVGHEVKARLREAILAQPQSAWRQAIDAEGTEREGAHLTELTDRVDLSPWPEGTRLIVRRERPHPGAQFEVFDTEGYRHTAFLTDQDSEDIAALEMRHRQRARVEDAIRTAPPGARRSGCRAAGLGRMPLRLPSRGCGRCPSASVRRPPRPLADRKDELSAARRHLPAPNASRSRSKATLDLPSHAPRRLRGVASALVPTQSDPTFTPGSENGESGLVQIHHKRLRSPPGTSSWVLRMRFADPFPKPRRTPGR